MSLIRTSVRGSKEVERLLRDLVPREANNLARATNHAVAASINIEAKRNAPKGSGLLRKSMKVKRRRGEKGDAVHRSDLFVVRTYAKGDAFYWRFPEYGTSTGMKAVGFYAKALDKSGQEISQLWDKMFMKKLVAMMVRNRRKAAARARIRIR